MRKYFVSVVRVAGVIGGGYSSFLSDAVATTASMFNIIIIIIILMVKTGVVVVVVHLILMNETVLERCGGDSRDRRL